MNAPEAFNGTVLAIDEFHYVSADTESSRLCALLRDVMNGRDSLAALAAKPST